VGVIWEFPLVQGVGRLGSSLTYKPMLKNSERGLESQVGIEGLGKTKKNKGHIDI